jgi:hypothetical protein
MKKILDFKSFLNESSSLGAKINLPPGVLKQFENRFKSSYDNKLERSGYSRRILSQIENLPLFKSLNTEDVDGDGYEEIVMKVDNKTIVFPYLKYDRNSDTLSLSDDFKNKKEIIDLVDLLVSYGLIKKHIEGIKSLLIDSLNSYNLDPDRILNKYCQSLIYNLVGEIKENISKTSKTFNPFTDMDLYNNENIKALQKMGTTIDSSPLRIKKGTLVLRNPVYEYGVSITPTGYIRRADAVGIIASNPELLKPIYNEEDLNVKLVYVRIYTMKKKLKSIGLTSKQIREIVDLIGKDPKEYAIKAKEIIKINPQAVLALPEPEEGFDKDLVKGASLLRSFGAFD